MKKSIITVCFLLITNISFAGVKIDPEIVYQKSKKLSELAIIELNNGHMNKANSLCAEAQQLYNMLKERGNYSENECSKKIKAWEDFTTKTDEEVKNMGQRTKKFMSAAKRLDMRIFRMN